MAKRYDIIVIDPPWPIKKIQRESRPNQGDTLDYPTMTIQDITNLPIGNMANDNSMCFLCTINQFLEESLKILRVWGFKFHLSITWDKQNGMCLFGFHRRTELIVVGYKGHMEMYPKKKAMPTIITESSWGKHSVKPDILYEWAETFGQDCIDLFARELRLGWDAWGNEVPCDIDMKDYRNG